MLTQHPAVRARDAFDWQVPDYAGVIRERIQHLHRIRRDRDLLPALLAYYQSDPYRVVEFIEDWGVTYDPRRVPKPAVIPFILFPRQREYLRWITDRVTAGENGIVEKSRDMGITWLAVGFSIYRWRFFPGTLIGFGSRVEDLVDKMGDPDSIFEKIRIYLRNLPPEFLPARFDEKTHAKNMNIVNPDNGSGIKGWAGDEIGRGGRSSIFFLDEAASIERPDLVEAALSNNTDVRIDQSTPRGPGNPFYRKRMSGQYPVFTFHWRSDPRKDQAWYDRMVKLLDPVILAVEVDIDYFASIENVVIEAKWVRAAQEIGALMDWPYYRRGVAGLDVAAGGVGKSVFIARFGPFVDPPVSWSDGDTTSTAERAMDLAWDAGVDYLYYDTIGVGKGVAATLRRLRRRRVVDARGNQVTSGGGRVIAYIEARGVNAGLPASDDYWPDEQTAQQKFANVKAEMWWLMRQAFQATYEHYQFLKGDPLGRSHPPDDLVVLPADTALALQLSQPTWDRLNSGKIAIESKESLRRRGVASPDHADALALTFARVSTGFAASAVEGMY